MKTLNKIIYLSFMALFISIMSIPAISKADTSTVVIVSDVVTITSDFDPVALARNQKSQNFVANCSNPASHFGGTLAQMIADGEANFLLSLKEPLPVERVAGFLAQGLSKHLRPTGDTFLQIIETANTSSIVQTVFKGACYLSDNVTVVPGLSVTQF